MEVPDMYEFVRRPECGGGFGIRNVMLPSPVFILTGSEAALDEGRAITVALNAWHLREVQAESKKHG